MKGLKFSVGLVCAMCVGIAAFGAPETYAGKVEGARVDGSAASWAVPRAAPLALPYTWDLATDFRVSPKQANPNPDSYGNAETWSFLRTTAAHDPTTYSLITQFYPNCGEQPGLQGWQGPEATGYPNSGAPAFTTNTTGVPNIFASSTAPPGVVEVHPDSSQPAIVGWRSPFTGSISIVGGVTDLCTAYGDGILWYVDKNGSTVASGSYANGGAQLFKDGTNGNALTNIPVSKGDSIYFLVAPGGDYYCDSTQLDVTINMIAVSKPDAPTLIKPEDHATLKRSGVQLKWSAVPYADRYRVVVKDEAMNTVAALTVYAAAQVKVSLPLHGTYFWNVQACNTGGCSVRSETRKFEN